MKSALLLLCALMPWLAEAQTNEWKTVLVTNWVAPGPFLRVVDGVTYNTAYSQRWGTFSDFEHLGRIMVPDLRNADQSRYALGQYRIHGEIVFYPIVTEHLGYDFGGDPHPIKTDPSHTVIILHCDSPGETGFLCMPVGDYIDGTGNAYKAYDCGVQATNPVMVVKKTRIRAHS